MKEVASKFKAYFVFVDKSRNFNFYHSHTVAMNSFVELYCYWVFFVCINIFPLFLTHLSDRARPSQGNRITPAKDHQIGRRSQGHNRRKEHGKYNASMALPIDNKKNAVRRK